MNLYLTGKTALVTGSYRGTGEIIAKTLHAEGAKVIFHSHEAHGVEARLLVDENCLAVWGDLTTAAGVKQILEQINRSGNSVDILVNNYGTAAQGSWQHSTSDDWLDMYQKNVLSAVALIQGLVEPMKAKGWGRIIQLGTVGSHQPAAVMPHYYSAKGALATMSVSLTQELSNTGITVNTVSPGYVRTAELQQLFTHRTIKEGFGDRWEDVQAQIVARDFPNPCGRIAEREEVADLVAFLCSERAGFINGQNIRVDGGAVAYV